MFLCLACICLMLLQCTHAESSAAPDLLHHSIQGQAYGDVPDLCHTLKSPHMSQGPHFSEK